MIIRDAINETYSAAMAQAGLKHRVVASGIAGSNPVSRPIVGDVALYDVNIPFFDKLY